MTFLIPPPITETAQLIHVIQTQGYAVIAAADVSQWAFGDVGHSLNALVPSWNGLPLDGYLKDGGRYRRRRHSCFIADANHLIQVPHRAHWQPLAYNALHGGMERMFEPIEPAVVAHPAWQNVLRVLANQCSSLKGEQPWFIEAHQFRIDTTDGIGRPTPEGAHRDGVDFVAVLVVGREGIKGGETRVFESDGPNGQRFTLTEPWTLLFLDDEKVIHESTPIQPLSEAGHRDTLVLTFRRGGFQGFIQ